MQDIRSDINEAITNYISYVENNCAKTKYSKEIVKNGYKALDNKDLQLEYLISGFNSMLNSLEMDERFGNKYRRDMEYYKEEYDKMCKENLSIKQEYKVADFTMQITEYKEMLEKLRDKNMFTQKSIDKCKKALDNVVLQEDCVKHIVKDIMFKIKARNKALAEARAELELKNKL